MHTIQHFPGRLIDLEGQHALYFGGTSYLGMASLPAFQNLLFEQIKQWGTAYGSSRNANVQLAVYKDAEQALANYIGAEAVVCLSSGMLAGQLVLETLAEENYSYFHHAQTHPAIRPINSQPLFVDGDLNNALRSASKEAVVICVDSMPGMYTSPIDLDFLKDINLNKEVTLLLDESHALGIVGANGSGIYNDISMQYLRRKIAVSSLGKALGLAGGMIGADAEFISTLRKSAKFISASAANPAFLGLFLKASPLYAQQRILLCAHLNYIKKNLQPSPSLDFDMRYPVIYCKEPSIADVLEQQGIIITKFRYPTYTQEMLRIVISAHHHQEDIKKLIEILNKSI